MNSLGRMQGQLKLIKRLVEEVGELIKRVGEEASREYAGILSGDDAIEALEIAMDMAMKAIEETKRSKGKISDAMLEKDLMELLSKHKNKKSPYNQT